MLRNIRMTVAYDGTRYLGWQKNDTGASVEEELLHALEQILQHPVTLQAASRTDAGVHAIGQVVNFFSAYQKTDLEKLQYGINSLISDDIAVTSISETTDDFHPTLSNKGKEYHYKISTAKVLLPLERFYCWHCPGDLNLHQMQRAAYLLVGEHDFKAFCNKRKDLNYENTIREIFRIEIKQEASEVMVEIEGNHFLYKMARNIVGILVAVGQGKISPERVSEVLLSKDRKLGAITAPACGLSLVRVIY